MKKKKQLRCFAGCVLNSTYWKTFLAPFKLIAIEFARRTGNAVSRKNFLPPHPASERAVCSRLTKTNKTFVSCAICFCFSAQTRTESKTTKEGCVWEPDKAAFGAFVFGPRVYIRPVKRLCCCCAQKSRAAKAKTTAGEGVRRKGAQRKTAPHKKLKAALQLARAIRQFTQNKSCKHLCLP